MLKIDNVVVQLLNEIANKSWDIADQESATKIDTDWFGDFHRYSLIMNEGNMSKKRKSRKQLKREHKELGMLLEGSDADNRENYAKLQEARIEVEKWQRSICQERAALLERNIEVAELKAKEKRLIKEIRRLDIQVVRLQQRIAELEAERDVVLDYSYLGEGEPPPGITRHVLGELCPYKTEHLGPYRNQLTSEK